MTAIRTATVSRKTNETDISITLAMDCAGAQAIQIDSGIGFLDHVNVVNIYFFSKILY